jgi:hypothetical protein
VRPRLRSTRALVLAALLGAAPAAAFDQQITSTLSAEGYSVPRADGSWTARRRIVEDLRLGAWNLLPGSADPYYLGPRLSVELALRLDTDFAVGGDESNPGMDSAYVPGLTPMQVDATVANLSAEGLWRGALDVRAGRQIRVGTLGFFAFDGAETKVHLPIGASLATYLGYEVRGGDVLGWSDLELDGTDSGGRHGLTADRFPDRQEPDPRLAAGAELALSPVAWLDAAAAVQAVGLDGPIASQEVGGRMTIGGEPLLADARVVWNAMLEVLGEADAELAVTPIDALTVAADYHLFRPTFEGDSIFNVFDIAPENDAGGRVEVRPSGAISLAGWGFARLADGSAGIDGTAADASVSGAGGGLGGAYRTLSRNLSLRLSGVWEWGEKRLGAEAGAGQAFWNRRLWLALRLSTWHIDDAFSDRLSGNLAGYVLSGRFTLTEGAVVAGEFEHYVGGGMDQRFTALAILEIEVWR